MNEAEAAYVAGLFEGEGTVGFWNGTLQARIKMTDLEPLVQCLNLTAVGRLNGPYERLDRKPSWSWQVTGERAVTLYWQLQSWLGPRRRQQFESAIAAFQARPRRPRRYKRPTSPDCGRASRSGYVRHRRLKEVPCAPCRTANARYAAERKAA